MARKYSLAEIDNMRDNVVWMRKNKNPDAARGEISQEGVEEELRTLMAAGVGPGELSLQRADRALLISYDAAWRDARLENAQRDCPHRAWGVKHDHYCFTYLRMGVSYGCDCKFMICTSCGVYNRRRKNQGRPGGRREGDKPRTSPTAPPLMTAANTPACSCGSTNGKHPIDCAVFAKKQEAVPELAYMTPSGWLRRLWLFA